MSKVAIPNFAARSRTWSAALAISTWDAVATGTRFVEVCRAILAGSLIGRWNLACWTLLASGIVCTAILACRTVITSSLADVDNLSSRAGCASASSKVCATRAFDLLALGGSCIARLANVAGLALRVRNASILACSAVFASVLLRVQHLASWTRLAGTANEVCVTCALDLLALGGACITRLANFAGLAIRIQCASVFTRRAVVAIRFVSVGNLSGITGLAAMILNELGGRTGQVVTL